MKFLPVQSMTSEAVQRQPLGHSEIVAAGDCNRVFHIINNRFLRERGMASNPKMEYQVLFCIFQKNSTMATLGLKEMGKFLWEGKSFPSRQSVKDPMWLKFKYSTAGIGKKYPS